MLFLFICVTNACLKKIGLLCVLTVKMNYYPTFSTKILALFLLLLECINKFHCISPFCYLIRGSRPTALTVPRALVYEEVATKHRIKGNWFATGIWRNL